MYVTVVYFITEQPTDSTTYFKVVLIYILLTIVADGIGVTMGTLLNPVVSQRPAESDDRVVKL